MKSKLTVKDNCFAQSEKTLKGRFFFDFIQVAYLKLFEVVALFYDLNTRGLVQFSV